jgi:uncharacterized membrane protein
LPLDPVAISFLPVLIDLVAVASAAGVAVWLRPWRTLDGRAPPGPWFAIWAMLPVLWGLDRYTSAPSVLSMSGASLFVLFAGWPLAVLAMLPVGVFIAYAGPMPALEALHRVAWWGVVPASFALVIGAALRRWLPNHMFVYILGRGFLGTIVAVALARWIGHALHGPAGGASAEDQMVADVLAAFGEGFITGMFTAIVVAFQPQWLATYADRIYLPPPPRP